MNTACVLYVTWKQACFSTMAEHQWGSMLFLSSQGHTSQLFQFSQESPSFSSNLPLSWLEHQISREIPTVVFFNFFSLISLFWRCQKRKIKQEVDLALLFELFLIGKRKTEHRHWLEINQSNCTIHGRKVERFSNAVIDISNIRKAFGWFSESS